MRLFRTKKRIAVVATATVMALAGGGAALAFFTTTGNGNGNGSVGTATPWDVTAGLPTGGPLLPGAGTETITFTIHNASTAAQHINTLTATMKDDGTGNVMRDKTTPAGVPGCLTTWFTPTVGTPSSTTVPAGGNATVDVTLTMADTSTDQNPCQNLTNGPLVTLAVT